MKKIVAGLALCSVFLAPCGAAQAQQSVKMPRIGLLSATSPKVLVSRMDALREGLRALGYVEGKNILIEYRYADGKFERLVSLAEELARIRIDVIVSGGPAGTRPAKRATSTIPIVMVQEADPVGSGFVASLSHPGGNVTGLSTLSPEVSGKQIELLKETVAHLERVAVVGNSTEPGNARSLRETQIAGGAFGMQVHYFELKARKDIETIFSSLEQRRAGALIVLRNPIAGVNRKRILDSVLARRLPGMYPNPNWVKAGGLMYYGASISDNWRRAATYVDKILKGAKPGELPVEQPTKFELVVNLRAAKRMGVNLPPSVLYRADVVIR